MLSDLIQISFEWFVTDVWERYGPAAGVLAGTAILVALMGAIALAIRCFT